MNKKIVKAMFSYAVSKEEIRPMMRGVHFTEDVCVASDTHILVVYKETNPKHVGRTILEDGEDAKGKYPDYKRVIPKKGGMPVSLNWSQLYRAAKWFKKQPDYNPQDSIAVGDCCVTINYIVNVLEVFNTAGDLGSIHASTFSPDRPMLLESEQLTAIVMPIVSNPEDVDLPRVDCERITLSYANLINTFAIESSKPKEKVEEMAWL